MANISLKEILPLPEELISLINLYAVGSPTAKIIQDALTWRVCIDYFDNDSWDDYSNYFIKDKDEAMELLNNPTQKHRKIYSVFCEQIFKDFKDNDDWDNYCDITKRVKGWGNEDWFNPVWTYCNNCQRSVPYSRACKERWDLWGNICFDCARN